MATELLLNNQNNGLRSSYYFTDLNINLYQTTGRQDITETALAINQENSIHQEKWKECSPLYPNN